MARLLDTTTRHSNPKLSKSRWDDPQKSSIQMLAHDLTPETEPLAVKGHHPIDCGARPHGSQFTKKIKRHTSMAEPPTSYLSARAGLIDVSKSNSDIIDLTETTSQAAEVPPTPEQDPLHSNSALKNRPALRVPTGSWISQEVPFREDGVTQVVQRGDEIRDLGPSHSAQLLHSEMSPSSSRDEGLISQVHRRRGSNIPSAIDSDWYPLSAMSTSYDSQNSDINASCPQHCSGTVSDIQDGPDYLQFGTSTFTQYASAELSYGQSPQRYIRPRKPDLYENFPTVDQYWTFEESITISMLNAMALAESCRGTVSGTVLVKPRTRTSRIGFWNYISCRPDIRNDPYHQ